MLVSIDLVPIPQLCTSPFALYLPATRASSKLASILTVLMKTAVVVPSLSCSLYQKTKTIIRIEVNEWHKQNQRTRMTNF